MRDETSLSQLSLTAREREVLDHLASGCTYVSAARRMHISKHTVDAHVRAIKRKAGGAAWPRLLALASFRTDTEGRTRRAG
jgi:DNA-binding CsgD family transcriptional regulator